jgi:hypothetical protein
MSVRAAVWGQGQFQVSSIDGDPTLVRLFVMPRSQADSATSRSDGQAAEPSWISHPGKTSTAG